MNERMLHGVSGVVGDVVIMVTTPFSLRPRDPRHLALLAPPDPTGCQRRSVTGSLTTMMMHQVVCITPTPLSKGRERLALRLMHAILWACGSSYPSFVARLPCVLQRGL